MKSKILSIAIVSMACVNMAEARFFLGFDVGYTAAISEYEGKAIGRGNTRFLTVKPSSWGNAFKTITWSDAYGAQNTQSTFTQDPYTGFNINLNFGNEYFFLYDLLGLRIGGFVGYTTYSNFIQIQTPTAWGRNLSSIEETYGFLDAGANLDVMINFWSNGAYSFGVFGGIEVAYHYLLEMNNSETRESEKDYPCRHSLDFAGRLGVSTLVASHHRFDILAKLPVGSVVSGDALKVNLVSMMPNISINVGYKYVF